MIQSKTYYLSLLFLHEGEGWVAQGLEYDVTAQGKTMKAAMKAFEKTIVGQVVLDLHEGKEPLQGIPPAPDEYWQKFEEGERLADQRSFRLPAGILPGFITTSDRRVFA